MCVVVVVGCFDSLFFFFSCCCFPPRSPPRSLLSRKIHAYFLCAQEYEFSILLLKEYSQYIHSVCVTWSITGLNHNLCGIEETEEKKGSQRRKSKQTRTMQINKHISLAHYRNTAKAKVKTKKKQPIHILSAIS